MNDITNHRSRRDIAADLYAAIAADDLLTAAQHVSPDVVLHVPGTHPLAGEHRGLMAFAEFTTRTRALTVDGERIDVLDVLEGAGSVAVHCRVRAERADGARLDNTTLHLLHFEGDLVREVWLHNWDDLTVDRFWSGAEAGSQPSAS